MGALPKNKITRAERGKRRAGNTPSLKKDPNVSSIPLHKRGIVGSILAATGLKDVKQSQANQAKEDKSKKKAKSQTVQPVASPAGSKVHAGNQAQVSAGRKTQHKG